MLDTFHCSKYEFVIISLKFDLRYTIFHSQYYKFLVDSKKTETDIMNFSSASHENKWSV